MVLHPPKTLVLGINSVAFLDLLRALAANLVLLGHAADVFGMKSHLPTGQLGVSIFFILSGFLIMQSSLARIQRPAPYFSQYIIDRFARIFTAYVPVLFLVAVLNSTLDLGNWAQEGISTGPVALIGNLLLLQDYPLFQAGLRLIGNTLYIHPYNTAEPFWTIPVEFWIYVAFGLGFFGLIARERIGWLLSVVLAAVALPVVIWNAAAGGGNGLSLVWVIGAATAYIWATSGYRSAHKFPIGCALLLTASSILLGRGLKNGWNFQDLGMSMSEALIVLGGVSLLDSIPPLPQAVRSLCTVLASYSYTLYLVHNTVLITVQQIFSGKLGASTILVALVMSHVVAFVLYLLFERHYRHVGNWLKRRVAIGTGRRTEPA